MKMCRGTLRMRSSTARLRMPCSCRRWISRSRVRAEVMPMPAKRMLIARVRSRPEPGAQRIQGIAIGQVHGERRHRDIAVGYGVEVRAGACILAGAGGTDPVDRTAARIFGANHVLGAVAIAEARDLDALHL